MTLIDVWAALNEGYLPTNTQLTTFIEHETALFDFGNGSSGSGKDRLSPSGRAFAQGILELRRLLVELIRHRNQREEVQTLVWELSLAAARESFDLEEQRKKQADAGGDPGEDGGFAAVLEKERRKAKKAGKLDGADPVPSKSSEALRHLRTVVRILLVQPQIRYVISDAITLFAKIAATTAEEMIPVAQGQMEQVSSEAPKLKVKGEGSSVPLADAQQAVLLTEGGEASSSASASASTAAPGPASVGANGFARITPETVDAVIRNPNIKLNVPLTASTIADAAQMAGVAQSKLHVVDGSALAQFGKKVTKDFATNAESVWSAEGQFKALDRLRKLCVDLQRSRGYKEAAQFFLTEAKRAFHRSADGIRKAEKGTERFETKAFDAVLDLLENFGGEGSARAILAQTQSILHKASKDEQALSFFSALDTFIERALLEELYATTREAEQDAKALHAQFLSLNKELREDLLQLMAQVVDFAVKLAQDEYLDAFVKQLHAMLMTFVKTSDDKWGLNASLWQDVTLVILPTLVTRLGVLPIPRIMYTHPDFDFVVENVALELSNLIPKYLDGKDTAPETQNVLVKIKVRGMSLRVHRFAFAFTAKKGIKFHDHGIADLKIGGFGLSINLEIPRNRKGHYFIVRKCKAKLEQLKFYIRKSNHPILHAVTSGITNSFATRKILSLIIGRGIGLSLKQLDLALMEAHLRREEERRLGIERKTEISLDELRSRAAAVRDLMRKYNESAGTFRIDFTAAEDPKNEKKWEEAHAVRWIKDTLERTGAKEEKVLEWRNTAFGEADPVLVAQGRERRDGNAARLAVKAERGIVDEEDQEGEESGKTELAAAALGGGKNGTGPTSDAAAVKNTSKAVKKPAKGWMRKRRDEDKTRSEVDSSSSKGAAADAHAQPSDTTSSSSGPGPVLFTGQLETPRAEKEAIAHAEADLERAQWDGHVEREREEVQGSQMESAEGKKAVRKHSDVSDQVGELEKVVDRQAERAAAGAGGGSD
ncbi:hypothetical protein OC844_001907 [Tilletia horrida]|nr:hypothetical protein OC844_001907 [Tilletia horrida]